MCVCVCYATLALPIERATWQASKKVRSCTVASLSGQERSKKRDLLRKLGSVRVWLVFLEQFHISWQALAHLLSDLSSRGTIYSRTRTSRRSTVRFYSILFNFPQLSRSKPLGIIFFIIFLFFPSPLFSLPISTIFIIFPFPLFISSPKKERERERKITVAWTRFFFYSFPFPSRAIE